MRPMPVAAFERVFLASLVLGVVQALQGWDALAARGSSPEMLALLVLTFGTLGALALLVSRGRSRSAKWVLVLLWVIGLPMFLSSWNAGTVIGWRSMAMLQAALQVAALALLFTRSARDWLRAP